MMRNTFYFTSNALFVLKILDFLSIIIDILSNILRSKGNQNMKFGQLIEYNMRKIFFEKSYTKYSGG